MTSSRLPHLILAVIATLHFASCSKTPPKDPLLERAEAGDEAALMEWAAQIAKDESRREEALEWYRKAAENGSVAGRFTLANALLEQHPNEAAAEEAITLLQGLADEQSSRAIIALAKLYHEGERLPKDEEHALKLYKQAAELNDPTGAYFVILDIWIREGQTMNAEQRKTLKTKFYDLGNGGEPRAFGGLGRILDREGDATEAEKWHFKAAQAGDPFSMYRVGIAYHRYVRDPSYGPLGFENLKAAEAGGIREALRPLAMAYYRGNGITQDKSRGKDLLLIAAWRGDADAQEDLVKAYVTSPQWGPEESIDVAAFIQGVKDITPKFRFILRQRIPIQGRVFDRLARRRAGQIDLAVQNYQTGNIETFEMPEAKTLWERYGSDAERARTALTGTGILGGEEQIQMARKCLSPENPYHNPEEAVDWMMDASANGDKDAGRLLYQIFLDNPESGLVSASEVLAALEKAALNDDCESALILAKSHQGSALAEASPIETVRYGLLASACGLSEGMELAESTVIENPDYPFDAGIAKQVFDALAANGDPKYRLKNLLDSLSTALDGARYEFELSDVAILYSVNVTPEQKEKYENSSMRSTVRSIVAPNGQIVHATAKPKLVIPSEAFDTLDKILVLADEGYLPALKLKADWTIAGFYLEPDPAKGLAIYQELVDADPVKYADLYAFLGWANCTGKYLPLNYETGVTLLRKGYELGSQVARDYFTDKPLDEIRDYRHYVEVAYRALEKGDSDAMLAMADFFHTNQAYEKTYQDSEYAKWLSLAAKNDNLEALTRIGLAYVHGEGVEKNTARGLRYLERCADLGSDDAQYVFAQFLILGTDIQPDPQRGLGYMQKSAEQGYVQAKAFLASVEATYPDVHFDTLTQEQLIFLAAANFGRQDVFPVSANLVENGELIPIQGVARERPIYFPGGKEKLGERDQESVFLAAAAFHPARMDVTAIHIDAPFVFLENGLVYTGRKPAISFKAKTDRALSGVYCLLLVDNIEDSTSFEWKYLGDLKADKERKIRFPMTSNFVSVGDVALYFFVDGKELASDIRTQPNHFIARSLKTFTKERYAYLNKHSEDTLDAVIFASVAAYIGGLAESFGEGGYAYIDVTELGYVSKIRIDAPNAPKARDALLKAASRITFLPSLDSGTPKPAKAKIALAD